MKVSIVIPAHNEEKYIAKTVEAALAQNCADFEVIVVDNASTDATRDIVKKYPHVKLVREERRGSQYARERGRVEASGDIIASLDADSIPNPDWISNVVHCFDDSRVSAVSGPVDYFDGPKLFRRIATIVQKTLFYWIHFIVQSFRIGAVMLAGNMIIRSSALSKIGGYETSITFYGDDTDTAKRLMANGGKIIFKPDNVIKSSARRFNQYGVIKTFYLYVINFLWITFFKVPFSQRKNLKKEAGVKI